MAETYCYRVRLEDRAPIIVAASAVAAMDRARTLYPHADVRTATALHRTASHGYEPAANAHRSEAQLRSWQTKRSAA